MCIGFLLMAFDESGDKTPIGTFSSTSDADNARTLNCLGVPKVSDTFFFFLIQARYLRISFTSECCDPLPC